MRFTSVALRILLAFSLLGWIQLAAAQEPAVPGQTPTTTAQSAPVADSTSEKEERGSLVIAPLPMVSPALGNGIVPVVAYIFPFQVKDKVSPPSVITAAGLFTDNGSRAGAIGADLFMKENRYELMSFYLYGKLDYNLYNEGNLDIKLPLEQDGQFFSVKFLRNIGKRVFAGGKFVTGSSVVSVKPSEGETPPIPPDTGLRTHLRAVGVDVFRDSRPDRFYPRKGSLFDFTASFFAEGLGSKYSFQSYQGSYSKYQSLGKKHVMAYNGYVCATTGEPPFYGNCIYGAGNQLRGYTAGRYLDRYMLASQAEYRMELPWRFGVVGFGGIGGVIPGGDQPRTKQFLPAGGRAFALC